ncbi:hypothetical protein J3Q64DRAFT_1745261 [Phycomyces blakesleeanus]|uniref:Uncharacterized protein n=2 Tax=Phycomyces blakesleeanus TaxID=4837 RepID=A0A167MVQ6_PHYB8|nr:hypothetical protein PHYBLDRAFT_167609 [Phycomyces blakesleeanus NRRL 1555(-)]OAD74184.1 hypothetical protein PHYBLDRAFT_167609 [Phycomyces blakesleeanus NRRL 1555(-)]|eukprot:XP_018292224.1 hypothetical protein PHYBLDRAFT_167609 [Phycomyces blakesleeanus NRRL 1555(-)]
MTTNKRSRKSCPLCFSPVEEFGIHLDSSIVMCSDTKCDYPFNDSLEEFIKTTRRLPAKRHRSRAAKPPGFINDNSCRQGALLSNKEHLDSSSQKVRLDSSVNVAMDNSEVLNSFSEPSSLTSTSTTPFIDAEMQNNNDAVFDIMKGIETDGLSDTASRFSLADIEHLLGDEEQHLGEKDYGSSSVVTPKDGEELGWMTGLNDVFNFGPTDSKYDPLTGNQEFDILLGL